MKRSPNGSSSYKDASFLVVVGHIAFLIDVRVHRHSCVHTVAM